MLYPKILINLNAVCRNYKALCEVVTGAEVASVLKADAYGLGAEFVALKLYNAGCRNFWVAHISEAIALRKVIAHDAEIFVLQCFTENDINLLKAHKLTQVVNTCEEFNRIKGNDLPIVLFVETGLHRLGIREEEIELLSNDIARENIRYVMSHLGCASDPAHPQNHKQKENFDRILSQIKSYNPAVKATLSASEGTIVEKYYYDMVRIGGALYGKGIRDVFIPEPVVSFEAPVIQKYIIPAGTPVGYDATYTSPCERKIALLSVGYADGVPFELSNKGYVYFGDFKAPIIGKIAMDITTCDITDIPNDLTEIGCYAEILGTHQTIGDMSNIIGRTASSILTGLGTHSNRVNVTYLE